MKKCWVWGIIALMGIFAFGSLRPAAPVNAICHAENAQGVLLVNRDHPLFLTMFRRNWRISMPHPQQYLNISRNVIDPD